MDVKDASVMTEASGLVDEHDAIEQTSDTRRRPLQSPAQDIAIRWADRVCEVTVKAPLQSLAVAFLLGMWIARGR